MANLPETPVWETGIYQLEETDPVQGGPNGIDNQQGKQLANRTVWLKQQAENLGAGKLDLAALATQAEAIAGADNSKWMTPLRVAQAIAALATIAMATDTVAGKVELATSAETVAGVDTQRATHPAGVKAAIDSAVAALVNSSPTTLNTLSEIASALGNDPNFATSITALIGGKQPLDATLTALSGLTTAANQLIYSTGADAFSMTPLTAFGRSIIDDPDALATRNTLGLGDLATKNTSVEFGSSLAESGYQKLPSGLIIQWGYTSILANLASGLQGVSLTLPISFTTSLLNAFVSVTNDGGTGGARVEARWNKPGSSLTQVAMHYEEIAAVTQDNYRLSYLAIGY